MTATVIAFADVMRDDAYLRMSDREFAAAVLKGAGGAGDPRTILY